MSKRTLSNIIQTGTGQFRKNAATGDWVCFNTARANRPNQVRAAAESARTSKYPSYIETCPFCNIDLTGPSLYTIKGEVEESWSVRVVKNKYPTVDSLPDLSETYLHERFMKLKKEMRSSTVLNKFFPAVGDHEVVIETPEHNKMLAHDSVARTVLLIKTWLQRGKELKEKSSTQHILYYKNQGSTGGASIMHPHAQIVGLPLIPEQVRKAQDNAFHWYMEHGNCVYKQTIEEELHLYKTSEISRVVDLNEHFICFIPFAALSPFYCWIVPFRSCAHFEQITSEEVESFAQILHTTLRRQDIVLNEPDFNLVIRSAPIENRGWQKAFNPATFFRWHAVITPRFGAGELAGFEYSSGIYSNSSLPEENAETLRNCL